MVKIDGTEVGPVGFGLMGFTWSTKPTPADEAIKVLKHAVEKGGLFWNGGELYGTPDYNSLHLIRQYFEKYPEDKEKVRFNIKGGFDTTTFRPSVDEEGIQRSIKNCQSILGDDIKLDMYEPARLDPDLGVEVTLHALKKAYDNGQVKGVALSEVSGKTAELAYQILGPALKSLEVELSLCVREPLHEEIGKVAHKHNIPIVAYSPLARGILSGRFKSVDEVPELIRQFPWFQGDNMTQNLKLAEEVKKVADAKGKTPAQVALGWLTTISGKDGNPVILPIPGATSTARLDENLQPASLTDEDMAKLEAIVKENPVAGNRYAEHFQKYLNV